MIQTDIITAREAADLLKVHYSTVRRLLHQRKLPGFKVGADHRLSLKALQQWMEDQTIAAKNQHR